MGKGQGCGASAEAKPEDDTAPAGAPAPAGAAAPAENPAAAPSSKASGSAVEEKAAPPSAAPGPGFDTMCLHGGWKGDPTTGAKGVPVYRTGADRPAAAMLCPRYPDALIHEAVHDLSLHYLIVSFQLTVGS